eukprot:scaffold43373_cov59-Phaeocystis_antarctica.AAC.1
MSLTKRLPSKTSYSGSAAAIPTPRSNAPLKLSAACPPAGCSLRTWQVPGFLGASTSATELAAKTVPAMGEVIAFPARVCWSHAHVWARQMTTEWLVSVSFLGPQTAPPPRATHLTKACAGHALSSRATTPAHDHATSPLHAHAHSTRTVARVRVAPP